LLLRKSIVLGVEFLSTELALQVSKALLSQEHCISLDQIWLLVCLIRRVNDPSLFGRLVLKLSVNSSFPAVELGSILREVEWLVGVNLQALLGLSIIISRPLGVVRHSENPLKGLMAVRDVLSHTIWITCLGVLSRLPRESLLESSLLLRWALTVDRL